MIHAFVNGELHLTLSTSIYSVDILHKCFYWYLNEYTVSIDHRDSEAAVVIIRLKGKTLLESDISNLLQRIQDDLIDFKVRDTVTKETKTIRELLVAKAFEHEDELDHVHPGSRGE